ncbi:MAG: hypothetical protein MUF00_17600 [Gemmatimonadaceae bacterium]|nr:hypothetical protein [Gemmatimonadaceae bacterium]
MKRRIGLVRGPRNREAFLERREAIAIHESRRARSSELLAGSIPELPIGQRFLPDDARQIVHVLGSHSAFSALHLPRVRGQRAEERSQLLAGNALQRVRHDPRLTAPEWRDGGRTKLFWRRDVDLERRQSDDARVCSIKERQLDEVSRPTQRMLTLRVELDRDPIYLVPDNGLCVEIRAQRVRDGPLQPAPLFIAIRIPRQKGACDVGVEVVRLPVRTLQPLAQDARSLEHENITQRFGPTECIEHVILHRIDPRLLLVGVHGTSTCQRAFKLVYGMPCRSETGARSTDASACTAGSMSPRCCSSW